MLDRLRVLLYPECLLDQHIRNQQVILFVLNEVYQFAECRNSLLVFKTAVTEPTWSKKHFSNLQIQLGTLSLNNDPIC